MEPQSSEDPVFTTKEQRNEGGKIAPASARFTLVVPSRMLGFAEHSLGDLSTMAAR